MEVLHAGITELAIPLGPMDFHHFHNLSICLVVSLSAWQVLEWASISSFK